MLQLQKKRGWQKNPTYLMVLAAWLSYDSVVGDEKVRRT
jgi:hypothetical protein